MISNIVFDLGSVLIDGDFTKALLDDTRIPNEYIEDLKKCWIIQDNNFTETCTKAEYVKKVYERTPIYLRKYIPDVAEISIAYLQPMNHTLSLINSLRERGYNLYYLSNWNKWSVQELKRTDKFDFLKLLDGGVFSYETGYMKPDRRIYEYFLKKYELDPSTCIFFDDKKENITAAKDVGMKGILFTKEKGEEILSEFILNESVKSDIDKDYKPKGKKSLSYFRKVKLDKQYISKYKNSFKPLKHIRDNCDGYIYFDKDKCIAVLAVEDKGDCRYIQAIEIDKDYQGYGLSKQLLAVAVNDLKATKLSVNKKNKLAIDIYYKYGFKKYDENDNMIFMSINESYIEESKNNILNNIKDFNKELATYEYIVVNKDNSIIQQIKKNSFDKYEILSPSKFRKFKGGICWDYVAYESLYFKSKFSGVKFKTFFFASLKDNNISDTHTFLLFYLNDKVYWFEDSWKSHIGIVEYDSEDDALTNITNLLRSNNKDEWFIVEYNASSGKFIGINEKDYLNQMIKLPEYRFKYVKNPSKKVIQSIKLSDNGKISKISESYIEEMKRSELPDDVFGIPQERKYPMPDEKHTRSAIKLFNHVDPKYEKQLANKIIANMKKYNIPGSVVGDKNRLKKYLPKTMLESTINNNYSVDVNRKMFNSNSNILINFDKWDRSGNHNILFVTGLSGSGKSTLSKNMCKQYGAEYIEMDMFTLAIVKGLDRWFNNVNTGVYKVHPLIIEYFETNPNLNITNSWGEFDKSKEHNKFIIWLINRIRGNGKLYIIEGAQFFMKLANMDTDIIKGEPMVVITTPVVISWIRRIKRDTSKDNDIKKFIYHLKKDTPLLFKYYIKNEKELYEFIDKIKD